jgi:sarcosine oxidase
MPEPYDIIVLGLGGMGSSAAFHLARRGFKVLGIDQFTPAHDNGSSHGRTRVIRQSYYEDPAYVPLLLRAYELWRELESKSGDRLLFEVGGLMMGSPTSKVVSGSLLSACTYDLPHEVLTAVDIRKRFPAFSPDPGLIALYEKRAGYVMPERCVLAHLDQATRQGADLHFEEKVLGWTASPDGDGVVVRTSKAIYEAGRLVIAPGAWAPEILSDTGLPFTVERQVLYWIDPVGGTEPFQPDHFPIFIWEADDGLQRYGFPGIDGPHGGVKVAYFRAPGAQICTPETVNRFVHPDEFDEMKSAITPLLPALSGRCLSAATCMYTNTPDLHFVVAHHPLHSQVVIACGFSGHGFKFASVMGEVLADLAATNATAFDIGFLRPDRFASGVTS